MEIRVNKLVRALGMGADDRSVNIVAQAINMPELSINTKLSIIEINSHSSIIDMDKLGELDMMDLITLKNRIEDAIDIKEAKIQLEGAIQRLAFVGINEIRCNGYFISKIPTDPAIVLGSQMNFEHE